MRLLLILVMVVATGLLIACTATLEPELGASNGSTNIRCRSCPAVLVDRIIDGDTFQSANATIRLYGVDTPPKEASLVMMKPHSGLGS